MPKKKIKHRERYYLIQRMLKPSPKGWERNAFGGGLKNGGTSPEAVSLLAPIFTPDSMGAAQYEWGALPQALKTIQDQVTNYSRIQLETDKGTVYLFCTKEQWAVLQSDILDFVHEWELDAKGCYIRRTAETRDRTHLKQALTGEATDLGKGVVGGISVYGEPFFYTADLAMRDALAELLEQGKLPSNTFTKV